MSSLANLQKHTAGYHSYLIRLWQDDPETPWHVIAQSVQSGEVIRFADLDALLAFLWTQTTASRSSAFNGDVAPGD